MDTSETNSVVDSSTETDRVVPSETHDVQYELKIKPQYLVHDQVSQVAMDYVSDRDKEKLTYLNKDDDKSSTAVIDKFNKRNRNVLKGQNKSRAAFFHETFEQRICSSLRDVRPSSNPDEAPPNCANVKCRSIHDVKQYLQSKGDDIGPTCYIYSIKGHCPFGVSCRFGTNHLTDSGLNIVDEKKILEWQSKDDNSQINYLNKSLQHLLWKRKYNFEKSESICRSKDEMRSVKDEPMVTEDGMNGSVGNEMEDSEMGEAEPVFSPTKQRKESHIFE